VEYSGDGNDYEIVAGLRADGVALGISWVHKHGTTPLVRLPRLTAEQARELAAELEAAASELDRR